MAIYTDLLLNQVNRVTSDLELWNSLRGLSEEEIGMEGKGEIEMEGREKDVVAKRGEIRVGKGEGLEKEKKRTEKEEEDDEIEYGEVVEV